MTVASIPKAHIDFRFTERGRALLTSNINFDIPSIAAQAGIPMRGDLMILNLGGLEVAFRVVNRSFEILPGITTLRIDLGAPDEPLQ